MSVCFVLSPVWCVSGVFPPSQQVSIVRVWEWNHMGPDDQPTETKRGQRRSDISSTLWLHRGCRSHHHVRCACGGWGVWMVCKNQTKTTTSKKIWWSFTESDWRKKIPLRQNFFLDVKNGKNNHNLWMVGTKNAHRRHPALINKFCWCKKKTKKKLPGNMCFVMQGVGGKSRPVCFTSVFWIRRIEHAECPHSPRRGQSSTQACTLSML